MNRLGEPIKVAECSDVPPINNNRLYSSLLLGHPLHGQEDRRNRGQFDGRAGIGILDEFLVANSLAPPLGVQRSTHTRRLREWLLA